MTVTGSASADPTTAKELYLQGDSHFRLAEYADAIRLFKAAYRESPAAGLLYNLAQAYRLSGDCRQALWFYDRFAHSDGDAATIATAEPNRVASRACVARLDAAPRVARPRSWISWAGLGLGVAGVASAAGGAWFAHDAADQAHQREAACNDADGCTAAQAVAFDAAGHSSQHRALGLFVAGGLALAGGVTLYVLDGRDTHVTIAPTEHGATVALGFSL